MQVGTIARLKEVADEVGIATTTLDSNGILWITLTIDSCELQQEEAWYYLGSLFDELSICDDVKVAVVRGAGAGRPFTTYVKPRPGTKDYRPSYESDRERLSLANPPWLVMRIYRNVLACQQPIIAEVNGDAIMSATSFIQHFDIVFAADDIKFGDTHMGIGLNASVGAYLLPVYSNLHKVKEYLLTGDLFGARDAKAMGLVNEVYSVDQLEEETAKFARRLADCNQYALRWNKLVLNKVLRREVVESQGEGVAWGQVGILTDDFTQRLRT
jgi:enoyl-CoA hydratase/carnithine racemase